MCLAGLLACASLAWASHTPQILSSLWGTKLLGFGVVILLAAILLGAVGEETE